MKQKKPKWIRYLSAWMMSFLLLLSDPSEMVEAASSYSNAKEFYRSTGLVNGKHVEIHNGDLYFATQAKLASSSSNLRYYTLGFDITMTGGGKSVSFAVARGDSMQEVAGSRRVESGYEYLLYCISTDTLRSLAIATKNVNVNTVLSASKITIRMDAIMTTLQNGKANGAISETNVGGISITKNPVYRLKNSSDLNAMKTIFSGHTFESYKNITADLDNYKLSIYYQLGDYTSIASPYTSTIASFGSTTLTNVLMQNETIVNDSNVLLQKLELRDPSDMQLKRTGYHLPLHAEWKKSNGITYSASKSYEPKEIDAEAGIRNKGVVLYANWKPNTYKILFDANGGIGTMTPMNMIYDADTTKLRTNTFVKTGYVFKGWKDENGNAYSDKEDVSNLTSIHEGEIVLYAQWEPCVYKITMESGNEEEKKAFYEKYGIGFYKQLNCTNPIDYLSIPSKTGYRFTGYYSSVNGGAFIVGADGKILVSNTYFASDRTIYANWEAVHTLVTFDMQGGKLGSESAWATYDKVYPTADAPIREGFQFMGYFTQKNGSGEIIYNQNMASNITCKLTEPITLYAYWIDTTAPMVSITSNFSGWTKQEIRLTAQANDYGSGLKELSIYRIEKDGTEICVSTESLDGVSETSLSYINTVEGAIRYKAVAIDKKGNRAESYCVVYYDTTAPKGTIVKAEIDKDNFYFEIDITDINDGN